jgi:hypothetical protein
MYLIFVKVLLTYVEEVLVRVTLREELECVFVQVTLLEVLFAIRRIHKLLEVFHEDKEKANPSSRIRFSSSLLIVLN